MGTQIDRPWVLFKERVDGDEKTAVEGAQDILDKNTLRENNFVHRNEERVHSIFCSKFRHISDWNSSKNIALEHNTDVVFL